MVRAGTSSTVSRWWCPSCLLASPTHPTQQQSSRRAVAEHVVRSVGGCTGSAPSLGSGRGGGGRRGRGLVWGAGNAGPRVPSVRGEGRGHAAAVACVVAYRGAGVAEVLRT